MTSKDKYCSKSMLGAALYRTYETHVDHCMVEATLTSIDDSHFLLMLQLNEIVDQLEKSSTL